MLSKFTEKLYNYGRTVWDNVPQEVKDKQELDQHSFITGCATAFEPYCLTKMPDKLHKELQNMLKEAGDKSKMIIYKTAQKNLKHSPAFKILDNDSFIKGYTIMQLKIFATPFADLKVNIDIINEIKGQNGY